MLYRRYLALGILISAACASPYAYVAKSNNSITVFDTATKLVVTTIPTHSLGGMAVNPAGTRLYLTNYADGSAAGTVSVIDTANYSLIASIPVGFQPTSIVIDPTGARVYVSNSGSGSISIIDTSTNTVTGTILLGTTLYAGGMAMALNAPGTTLYVVSNFNPGNIAAINTSTSAVTTNICCDLGLGGLIIDSAGTFLYGTTSLTGAGIQVFSTSTNALVNSFGLASAQAPYIVQQAEGLAINPAGTRLYVSTNDGYVDVLDTSSGAILTKVQANQPGGLAVNAAGTLVYVADPGTSPYVLNGLGKDVFVVDTASNSVVSTIPMVGGPLSVVIGPAAAPKPPFTVSHDIDANGLQDISVYNSSGIGYQYSLLSQGNGTFSGVQNNGANPAVGFYDTSLQADFNGDGNGDILFYSSVTGEFSVGLGNGAGAFTYSPTIAIPSGFEIQRGDFNGDGKTDLLFYRQSDGAATLGLSNGDGTFTFIPQIFSPGFTSVAVADYNGDGFSDVIVYNNQTAPYNAYLLLGDGTGHFNASSLFFGSGYTVYPSDLNSDGNSDFILYRPSDGTVYVAISNGTSFSYHYNLFSPGLTSFKIGDVNGDGFPDLVLYDANNAMGYLLLGDGAGNFPTVYSLFFGPGMDFVDLRDFNGDGKQDVILYRTADGTSYTGISTGTGFSYTYNYFGPGRIVAQ